MKNGIDALLIEDSLVDAQLFEALISSAEFSRLQLHHSQRFHDALDAIQAKTFDVILLDLCLPDGRGIDLVKQLKERIPQVPIVVLTGIKDQDVAVEALQEGAQDYLVKSDTFSPQRIQKLGYVDIGNLLIKTLRYAIERAELIQQLAISKERYSLAVEGARDGIWDWNLITNRVFYSARWRSLIGLPNKDINDSPKQWRSRIHPHDRDAFEQKLKAHLAYPQRQQFHHEYRLLHADGNYRWVLTRGRALWDENGVAYRLAGSQTDMTTRKSLENALHQEKELAQITLHSIGDAVITTDEQGYIKDFNPVAERLTGWRAGDARERPISEVCHLVDASTRLDLDNPAIQAIEQGKAVSLSNHPMLVSRTGEEFAIGDSAAPIRSSQGEIVGTVLIFHDVTEERGRARQLAWQASHDPLTHLFNRQKFIQTLDEGIAEAQQQQTQHVLCCMDLDHFKTVNDTCGHAAGDQLLRQIAELWRSKIRASDSLARLGGDEFGLLLYDCDTDRAIEIANDFCSSIQTFRFSFNNKIFSLGVSVGLVPITHQTTSTEVALQLADSACYSAKNRGRNRVQVYYQDDQAAQQHSSDSQWFSRITRALDENRFVLYQQAILPAQAKSTDIELCEILLRLKEEDSDQVILPMAFIPPAERYNLMPQIDRWVIRNFLSYLSTHLAIHPDNSRTDNALTIKESLPINRPINRLYSINLSGASLNDDSFIDFMKEQFEQHPVGIEALCFEITETVAISNLQKAASFILELKQLGCQFALDDFGSGMSSFTYLKHLPVDFLKIDGNFVREAPTDKVICAMLEAINQVGHVMGLKTIAEYVEDHSILEKVRELGIDYVQGFAIETPKDIRAK